MTTPRLIARLRIVLLAAAALGFAAFAVVVADRHMARALAEQQAAVRKPETPTVAVVVAKFDLVAGESLGPDNMAVRSIPADLVPGSAVRPEQFDTHVGARLVRPMRSGETLIAEIAQPAEPAGLASRVRQGIRALTLAVDEVSSVSGLLRPGDRVDLLFSARIQDGSAPGQGELTRVLVQDVPVLATGKQVSVRGEDTPARGYTSITVELGPEDAKRVVAAQRAGRLTAMLRHPDDRAPVSAGPVDLNALLGLPTPSPRISAPPRPMHGGPEIITGGMGPLAGLKERSESAARPPEPSPDGQASPQRRTPATPQSAPQVTPQVTPQAALPIPMLPPLSIQPPTLR